MSLYKYVCVCVCVCVYIYIYIYNIYIAPSVYVRLLVSESNIALCISFFLILFSQHRVCVFFFNLCMCLSLCSPEGELETKASVQVVYLRMIPDHWCQGQEE